MSNKIYRNSDFFIKSATVKQDGTKEGSGLFSGYASTFDIDRVDDVILKGAFKNTINDRRRTNRRIPILWQHNGDEVLGSISPFDLEEDSKGLKILNNGGRLNLNVEKSREAFSLLQAGDIASMSIGFSIKDFEWKEELRVIKSVELFEISLVAEPANLGAEVTNVKSVTPFEDLPLAEQDMEWNSDEAIKRVREFTNSTDKASESYKNAFFWYDSSEPDLFTSYKLPFADVVDGRLVAIPRGVFASAAALEGARGGVDIPSGDRQSVVKHVERYYNKMGLESPFEPSDRSMDSEGEQEEKHKSYIDAKTLEKIETKRQFETILRESGLFSIKAAKILSQKFEPICRDVGKVIENQRDVGNEEKGVDCEQLKSIHDSLRDLIKLSKGR